MQPIQDLKLVLIAALLLGSQSISAQSWELPPGVKSLEVNGYPMAYVEKGSGIPLILVHGTAVDYRFFAAATDVLAQKHRVISVSLRHHHPEPWNGQGPYGYEIHADDVAAFIRELDVGRVHLLGHSYGGTVAFLAATKASEILHSAISAEGMGNSMFAPKDIEQRAERYQGVQKSFEEGKVNDGLQGFINAIGGRWDKLPDASKQSLRDNAWTIYANTKTDPVQITCESARALRIPVLLMKGEKTLRLYSGTTENLARCLTRYEIATIPGATHTFPRTHPDEFAKAVLDFTSKH